MFGSAMKVRSTAIELTNEIEKDLALVMLIERRHAEKIGSTQALELIEKVTGALNNNRPETASEAIAQDLVEAFPFH